MRQTNRIRETSCVWELHIFFERINFRILILSHMKSETVEEEESPSDEGYVQLNEDEETEEISTEVLMESKNSGVSENENNNNDSWGLSQLVTESEVIRTPSLISKEERRSKAAELVKQLEEERMKKESMERFDE